MKLCVDSSVLEMMRESFGPGWTIDDDHRFWRKIGGTEGLRKLCHDAKTLMALCEQLSEEPSDRDYMKCRARLVVLSVSMARLESCLCMYCEEIPHFFARFTAQLFSEMVGRAALFLEQTAPELLNAFGEIDGQASSTLTNRTYLGGTASGTAARPKRDLPFGR